MTRRLALETVLESDRTGRFVQGILRRSAGAQGLAPRDAALARTLALGSVRRRLTLDTILAAYARDGRPPANRRLREILRQAVLQILFLERIPPRAAVHCAVEIASEWHGSGVGRFVNGLLRTVARETRRVPLGGGGDSRRRLPLGGGMCVEFGRDVFADPRDIREHLAQIHSHPPWLVERWLERFGEVVARRALAAANEVPPLALRAHSPRADPEGIVEALRRAGRRARPGRVPGSVVVEYCGPVEDLPGFAQGEFTVQGEAAQEAVRLVGAEPGEEILEVGAAPGGKATGMAEAMGGWGGGRVVAADLSLGRLRPLVAERARLGLEQVHPVVLDGLRLPAGLARPFDRVLLDAPCSNTGVLGRRVEARWRIRARDLAALASHQARLLEACARAVRPGGILVYATCSLEPEENREVAEGVLRPLGWTRASEVLRIPGEPYADGGYAARWRRPKGDER